MLAVVVLVFAWRYFPRVAPWILVCVLLMCAGAVYEGYHYALDVIVGAGVGVVIGAVFVRHTNRSQPA
jgi:membrane-associated phospholipid phosphatase